MTQFLNSAKIAAAVPKIVETKKGYILNGTYYDKKSFLPESLSDLIMHGDSKSISLNRVANTHTMTASGAQNQIPCTRSSRIITDEQNPDIQYIFTEDYTVPNTNCSRYVYKFNENTKEIIKGAVATSNASTNWYVNIAQYIGQSEKYLYFLTDSNYYASSSSYQYNRSHLLVMDKEKLTCTYTNSGSDRGSYNRLHETERYIYVLYRKPGSAQQIYQLDKEDNSFVSIKTLPYFSAEIDRIIRPAELIMTDQLNGYYIDMYHKTDNQDVRWVDIAFSKYHPKALTTNGQPAEFDLKAEITYTVNGHVNSSGHVNCPLFTKNNHAANAATNENAFYWKSTAHYVDITFDEDVNIWRAGINSSSYYNGALKIEKYDDGAGTWNDITSTITQTLSNVTHQTWQKYIENLPAGRYKFSYNGTARIDGGWYLEKAIGNDYLTKEVVGIKDPDADITYVDSQFTLKDPGTMSVPNNLTPTTLSVVDFAITQGAVAKYMHQISFGTTQTNWAAAHQANACINTFRIDETSKTLEFTGSCPLSNMEEVCKSYVLNETHTRLLGLSLGNTFIHEFSEVDEKFIPVKYFAYLSKAAGFDTEDNIWIFDDKSQLLKYNEAIPENIDIVFEDTNLEYTGVEINTYIEVKAINFIGNQIESDWTLTISGNARFDETGGKEIQIKALDNGMVQVPLTITGAGVILIYPVLNLDVKN